MMSLADSFALFDELNELTSRRRYDEIERRLVSISPDELKDEPELGHRLTIAWLHLRKTQEATNLSWDVLKYAEARRDTILVNQLLLLRSIFLSRVGAFDAAEEAVIACMSACRWDSISKFSAAANNSLGTILCMRGEWEQAIPQLQRALAMYAQIGNSFGVAAANHNLGMANRYIGNSSAADQFFNVAADYFLREGTTEEKIFLEAERSLAVLGTGDDKMAEAMARRALDQCRRNRNPELLGECLRVMGTVCRVVEELPESRSLLREAMTHAKMTANRPLQAELQVELGLLEYREGRIGNALRRRAKARGLYNRLGATGFVRLIDEKWEEVGKRNLIFNRNPDYSFTETTSSSEKVGSSSLNIWNRQGSNDPSSDTIIS